MASYLSAWVIGSVKDLSATVTITGDGGGETIAGDLYLYHPTAALSIVGAGGAWVTAATAAGVNTPTCVLTRDRRVKIGAAANFNVTWTDVTFRDLLGFTQGNLSGASSYTAADPPKILWSPGKPLHPGLAPLGCLGNRRPLAQFTASPNDGSTFVVTHGTRTDQRWSASHVAIDRVQTDDALGGEWDVFFMECAAKGYSFYVYPEVTEEDGSATAVTPADGLGPYVLTPAGGRPSWGFARSRGFEWLNRRGDVSFDCRVVPEYS